MALRRGQQRRRGTQVRSTSSASLPSEAKQNTVAVAMRLSLQKVLVDMSGGVFDNVRGRALQVVSKGWSEQVLQSHTLLKDMRDCEEKRDLAATVSSLEKASRFFSSRPETRSWLSGAARCLQSNCHGWISAPFMQ